MCDLLVCLTGTHGETTIGVLSLGGASRLKQWIGNLIAGTGEISGPEMT